MNSLALMPLVPLPVFQDNYIWVLRCGNQALAVDPGDPAPVENHLQKHGLRLSHILITHHHADHTGGVAELLKHHPEVQVIAPQEHAYAKPHVALINGQRIALNGFHWSCTAIHTPGHTLDHVSYWLEDHTGMQSPILFCGDTLFSAGCGRLFEGSAEQMWDSLCALRQLDPETRVCAAHEYTLTNLQFASHYAGHDADIVRRMSEVMTLRQSGVPSLPSTIGLENRINLFLRADDDALKSHWTTLGLPMNATVTETLGWLRLAKNHFPSH